MATINFKTKLFAIGDWTILRLPEDASAKLPSRGQAMAKAVINGYDFQTPLKPDGKWSHWFRVDDALAKAARIAAGDTVDIAITFIPNKDWPEPDVPADIAQALAKVPAAQALWPQITPMARWEWIRWIRSTGNNETRKHRIEVACSKLQKGMRRPCCWNRNACSEPAVCKTGILLDPSKS